jgi:cell division protein FtsW
MAATTTSLTPSQRRRAVLDRKGYTEKRRLATAAPNRTFYVLMAVTSMLIVFGLMMVLSSSSIVAINTGGSPWFMFGKQFVWANVGLLVLLAAYRMPYHQWHRHSRHLLWFAYGLMALPFTPIGITINGARAWAELGPVRFQPSEFLKVAVIIYSASLLGRRRAEVADHRRTFKPIMMAWLPAVGACLVQKDFGAAVVITTIIIAVMFISGIPLRLIGTMGILGLAGATVAIASSARMQARIMSFVDLEGTREKAGYQVWQAILSIANGGVAGVGAGEGTGKWGYVPLAHSDFIFAIIAEEFGLIGSMGVIGGFILLAHYGIRAALGARDPFGAVLAGGITTWLCAQAIINIGGVVGVLPVTGLTLPLISYGGSSLLFTMGAVGLLLNVARNMK